MAPASKLLIQDPTEAAARLEVGGVVALPTETVYGLAARADDAVAVSRIFAMKQRPSDHPLIIHLGVPDPAGWVREGWIGGGSHVSTLDRFAERFWPGPLSAIVPVGPNVAPTVTGARPTVAVRVPDHPGTLEVLKRLLVPVAAPSANRFGRVSPTDASHVLDDLATVLDGPHDGILVGGGSRIGVESTIVDLTTEPPQVLRAGAIASFELEAVLGPVVIGSGPARASGMLAAHYAPNGRVEVAESLAEAEAMAVRLRSDGLRVAVIDRSSDPAEAARALYRDLRRANSEVDALVFVAPPSVGIGGGGLADAIRDRLERAATGTRPNRAS